MATDEQVQAVMNRLAEGLSCGSCGLSLRFGDYECPHCGADLEDDLRQWAEGLVDEISAALG